MSWLPPAIIATMVGTAILSLTFFYLYSQDRKKYLAVWALSWSIYFTRYIFALFMVSGFQSPLLLMGNQIASLVSGVILLWASFLFFRKKFPVILAYTSTCLVLWIIVSISFGFTFKSITVPTFAFLAMAYVWTGVIFLKSGNSLGMERHIVGWSFIIWGLHKGNYPFLRPVVWFAPWGYLLGALLEFMVAIGILLVYFKKTRNELKKSEENYRRLIDSQTDLVCRFTPDGTFVFVNQEYCNFFGKRRAELLGSKWQPLPVNDDLAEIEEKLGAMSPDNPIVVIENRLLSGKGEVRWMQFVNQGFYDQQGALHEIQSVGRDITDRKQAEEDLRKSEEYLRAVFQAADNVGFVATDLGGEDTRITGFSPGAENIFQYPAGEILGRKVAVLHLPDDVQNFSSMQENLRKGGKGFSGEITLVRKGGERFPALFTLHPLRDGSGEVKGTVGVTIDVSEKIKLEHQLRQAQKIEAVGRLAGGVAHDFNNMLGVILGHAEMALEQTGPGQEIHEDLLEIQSAAERSAGLTRQLLAFARKQTIQPRLLNLNDTVSSMLKMLQRLIGENITLEWKPGPGLWRVKIDPAQVDQILANLAVNARDAVSGAGRLSISTRNVFLDESFGQDALDFHAGEYVALRVADDGCGMDQETISCLFEPFFTTKNMGEGTGLGLSTVYGIVRQNHGLIQVSSEPGEGAAFTIYLPRNQDQESKQGIAETEKIISGNGETVLLVEDEVAIMRVGQKMLERIGFKVLTAEDPKEAIRIAKEHAEEIRLLITDVVMPDMNGRELAGRLKSSNPAMRVLYMSGYTADIIAQHGVLEEGMRFLQKPFSLTAIASAVSEALSGDN